MSMPELRRKRMKQTKRKSVSRKRRISSRPTVSIGDYLPGVKYHQPERNNSSQANAGSTGYSQADPANTGYSQSDPGSTRHSQADPRVTEYSQADPGTTEYSQADATTSENSDPGSESRRDVRIVDGEDQCLPGIPRRVTPTTPIHKQALDIINVFEACPYAKDIAGLHNAVQDVKKHAEYIKKCKSEKYRVAYEEKCKKSVHAALSLYEKHLPPGYQQILDALVWVTPHTPNYKRIISAWAGVCSGK